MARKADKQDICDIMNINWTQMYMERNKTLWKANETFGANDERKLNYLIDVKYNQYEQLMLKIV